MLNFNNVYRNKSVLITGHTGFKGSWLAIWLQALGAKVIGYSLPPYTNKDNFVQANLSNKIVDLRGDIRNLYELKRIFDEYQPEYVFHLAAQPIVRLSYEKPIETYEVNVMGTINVLECIRYCSATKVGILVTTDKCYENKEQLWGYRENDALGGYDPYSSSKGAAELAIQSWRQSFMNPKNYMSHGKTIASVRAGNVIGGGDWAQDRIIPDCIRAIKENKAIEIRNPNAIRPWEHVLEPLYGYLLLGEKMTEHPTMYSESWNFGPKIESIITVREIVDLLLKYYGKGSVKEVALSQQVHEANLLNLDISKAVFKLGWMPRLSIEEAVQYTVKWYQKYETQNVYRLCIDQIEKFSNHNIKIGEEGKKYD